MTTLRKVEFESFFLISIVAAASVFFVIQKNNHFGSSVKIASINSPLTLNPTQTPMQNIFSQISPDGTKKVIMKITQGENDTKIFSFYTADGAGLREQFIFSRTLNASSKMAIPFNTWSSDNQYFFVEENSQAGKSIFAYKATGEPFSATEPYFDVTELFKNKITDYKFDEATGWASESLIIINTKREDGSKGPSYWFEIPSKAIIQLSTEF